jgi:two-component system, LytTR family, sensor kinase
MNDVDRLDPPSARFVWTASAAIFTVTGFLRFTYKYFEDVARRELGTFGSRLIEESTGTYAAMVLFVAVVALTWRYPLDRPGWRSHVRIHGAALVAYSVAHTTILHVTRSIIFPVAGLGPYDYGYMPARYVMEFGNDAVSYAFFIILITVYRYRRTTQQREVRTAHLERGLAQAELRSLRLQLQPHFLFNALNTISSTMYDDPRSADRMIGQLSELLRLSLRTSHTQEVRLRDELDVLTCYLGLMRARFGERLSVTVTVPDHLHDALVPSLLLQPLVENAIRHGNASHVGRGVIDVRVVEAAGRLRLEIRDDGPGVPDGNDIFSHGVGLSATRDRLRLLYGGAHQFEAGNRNGGFVVSIVLPLRRSSLGSTGSRAVSGQTTVTPAPAAAVATRERTPAVHAATPPTAATPI